MSDNSYDVLASIYDGFQKRADTSRFFEQILDIVMQQLPNGAREERPLVCDLGCGTGDMALLLAQNYYDVIGIDQSEPMLNIARNKFFELGCHGLFLCQDILQFEMEKKADVFLCLTDTINHITQMEHLDRLFFQIARHLKSEGIFVFDTLTLDYMKNILGNNTFCFDEDQYVLVWENKFDPEKMSSQSELKLFKQNDNELYAREDCCVEEQYYSQDQINTLLIQTEMKCIEVIPFNDWHEDEKRAIRHIYVAQCNAISSNLDSK